MGSCCSCHTTLAKPVNVTVAPIKTCNDIILDGSFHNESTKSMDMYTDISTRSNDLYTVTYPRSIPQSPNSLTPESRVRTSRIMDVISPTDIELYRKSLMAFRTEQYGVSTIPKCIRTKPMCELYDVHP